MTGPKIKSHVPHHMCQKEKRKKEEERERATHTKSQGKCLMCRKGKKRTTCVGIDKPFDY